jgi:hypothetical protein
MSADFSAYLIFGIPVTEEDFWRVSGSKTVCPNGHEQTSPDMQFCPSCGEKFEVADLIEPTEALEKFAAEHDLEDHDAAWEALKDGDYGIGVYCASPMQGSESDNNKELVLGFKLMNVGEYGDNQSPISWGDLKEKRDDIRKAVESMRLERKEPVLATVLYCSY